MRHPFTLPEANALLPALERVFTRIDVLKTEIGARHDQLQLLEVLWEDRLDDPGNPDGAEARVLRSAMEEGVLEIQRLIRTEILAEGIRFPVGGLEHGLVDFPTTLDGRWVLLCWRRGEPELLAWHEIDAGFAGRQEITPDQARAMGTDDARHPLDGEDGGVDL
jgi:hypothetical protein